MTIPVQVDLDVPEGSTTRLTFTVTDEAGAAIAGSSLTTATILIFDEATGTVLAVARDIKPNIDGGGLGTVTIPAADNASHGTERVEWHVALVKWTYGAGKVGHQTIRFSVMNLVKVP